MKRSIVISMMIMVIVLMSGLVPIYAGQGDSVIRIQIDGETLHIPSSDQQPVIVDGRTLVPLRAVMEALGFTVYWDSNQRAAYLFMDARPNIMVPLQDVSEQKGYAISSGARHHFHGNLYTSNTRDANGVVITLDVPPQIINGRTMVPLRAIAEAADMDVAWNSVNRIAVINTRGTSDNVSDSNPATPPVTPPTNNVQPAPPANVTPPAAPAGLVALDNSGQTFVYAGTEPIEVFLAQLDQQGSHTRFARVHVFEVGTVITVRTTHAPALELLEGVGGIHLAVSEVVGSVLEPRCFDDHSEFTSPDRGYITRYLGDWDMISVDSHTLSYTANTPGRIYQVWAAGGMTVDIMIVAAGTTPPISNQPPTNNTTGSNESSTGWDIPSSGITLPNRRLTEAERQAWIDEYNQMGGATNFELEVVRLINEVRISHGLNPLEVDGTLMMATRFYSQTLANLNLPLGHREGPYGGSAETLRAFGIGSTGRNGNSRSTPEAVVNSWMNSEGHRNNILRSNISKIGVGTYRGESGRIFSYAAFM